MELAFKSEPMSLILPALRRVLVDTGRVTFTVPDPDLGLGLYAGEATSAGIHRPLSVWTDLADLLGAHLHTPEILGAGQIRLTIQRYAPTPAPDAAGYGTDGDWARVNKLEDPVFLATFVEALRRVNPPSGGRVLALGVNAGRELDALALAFADRTFEVLGVDVDESALTAARARSPNFSFRVLDVNTLPLPELGTFDLVLALSLLQSPGVVPHDLLGAIRRHHLTHTGGLILGFPNARYLGGHLSYGARMKNYARPDLSLLCADVTQARRQLQKHGFKVFVTGKYEVLVTAIPAGMETPTGLEF
ncbi:class I SAM-dependent methyltransferase [Deinococcus puniceus]|uniref:Methyltransferase type 12 n=1 Tax=Deinococcus puniceus TaxID=1182568 RepID=A0A172T729_9DEIO|nr:class I SAM-dependent methyltransferase [Deinococcus puniceus]ANE42754.1 methyltransferase type 12 [Deinococcus puniceus]